MCLLKLVRLDVLLHYLPRPNQVGGPSGSARCELQRPSNHLFDVLAAFDFARIPAILTNDLLLIRHVLNPMDVFGPRTAVFTIAGVGRKTGEDQHWSSAARGVVNSGPESLCSNIDVHDDTLGLAG